MLGSNLEALLICSFLLVQASWTRLYLSTNLGSLPSLDLCMPAPTWNLFCAVPFGLGTLVFVKPFPIGPVVQFFMSQMA